MGPEFEKGDGRLRPSLQQRLPGAEGPPEGCTTDPRHAACGGPLPSCAERTWSTWSAVSNRKKERKKTDNPREGWEDGTPPPHRDFKERGVMR